jgi:hypothetical protein
VDRDDWRVFRVDRIAEVFAPGARHTPRELPGKDPAAFVTSRMYSLACDNSAAGSAGRRRQNKSSS